MLSKNSVMENFLNAWITGHPEEIVKTINSSAFLNKAQNVSSAGETDLDKWKNSIQYLYLTKNWNQGVVNV